MSDINGMCEDFNDIDLYIFARTKNGVCEYHTGNSDFIDDFYNPEAWETSYDNCIPFTIYDAIEQNVAMLRLVYGDYEFEFLKLTLSPKKDVGSQFAAMDYSVRPDSD